MALRFLLVAVVAGMGFEMPSGQDVASWARSGRGWVEARLADLSDLRSRVEIGADEARAAVPTGAEAGPSARDLAFEAVVEGMASNFAVDLASNREEEARPAVVEAFHVLPPAAWRDPEPEVPAFEPAAVAEAPSASRVERISTAVRLTRQAVAAWASLIQVTGGQERPEDGDPR